MTDKDLYYVEKGSRWLCIKDVAMNGDKTRIAYISGKIYRSEIDGCITDEFLDKHHFWITSKREILSFFKRAHRNKRIIGRY